LKILLVNPFGIGDVLFSTPLIKILQRNYPKASLYFICNKRTHAALERCPQLKGIYVFEKDDFRNLWRKNKPQFLKEFTSFIKKIKKERFDLAIDMSMGHQYSFFLKILNIPERIGFDYKGRGRFLTRKLEFDGFNDKPIGEYYKDLLKLIDLDTIGHEPTGIWLNTEDRDYIDRFFDNAGIGRSDTVIGIAPGGGESFGPRKIHFKRWPKERFAELAKMLISKMGSKVILIWGPGEEGLVKEIVDLMDVKPIISPKTTIRQSAALMSRCDCVVCNDSGPLHIAVAVKARTVSIFGPSDPNVYGPYPKGGRHISIVKEIECSPCYKKFKLPNCATLDCLNGIDVKDVYQAVAKHIRSSQIGVKT